MLTGSILIELVEDVYMLDFVPCGPLDRRHWHCAAHLLALDHSGVAEDGALALRRVLASRS